MFFNRAAKVGSVSIIKLLEMNLSKQNDFAIKIDPEDTANNGKLSKKEQVTWYFVLYQLFSEICALENK